MYMYFKKMYMYYKKWTCIIKNEHVLKYVTCIKKICNMY